MTDHKDGQARTRKASSPEGEEVPRRCVDVGTSMVDGFIAHLTREAKRQGVAIPFQFIRQQANAFKNAAPEQSFAFRAAAEEACCEEAEESRFERMRTRPFDRLLVARFAFLFPPREGDEGSEDTAALSRRMIPGFAVAISTMIGAERYDRFQERCREIVDRYRGPGGIDWDEAYADPDGQRLVDDILIVIARYFEKFDLRQEWLTKIINENLGPVSRETPNQWERNWKLSERSFYKLINALFVQLRRRVNSGEGALEVKNRHGREVLDKVRAFFEELDRRSMSAGVKPMY